jgi:hypothetical protein
MTNQEKQNQRTNLGPRTFHTCPTPVAQCSELTPLLTNQSELRYYVEDVQISTWSKEKSRADSVVLHVVQNYGGRRKNDSGKTNELGNGQVLITSGMAGDADESGQ